MAGVFGGGWASLDSSSPELYRRSAILPPREVSRRLSLALEKKYLVCTIPISELLSKSGGSWTTWKIPCLLFSALAVARTGKLSATIPTATASNPEEWRTGLVINITFADYF